MQPVTAHCLWAQGAVISRRLGGTGPKWGGKDNIVKCFSEKG